MMLAFAPNPRRGGCLTIIQWLSQLTTKDGSRLVVKVSQCLHGEIELWHHVTQTNAAKAWLSTALAEIARLFGIDFDTNRPSAEDMFQNPDKVKVMLEKLNNGVPLYVQRDKFMEFNPPSK